jgi:hypothetical protein
MKFFYPAPQSRYLIRPVSFVWGVWLIMFLVAFACILWFGRNIPMAEDWVMVSPLTGNEPHFGSWLWRQNSEHRIPLPRLVFLFLLKVTQGDFRSGMVFNVLCAGFMSGMFIGLFKYIRGKTIYADAFFPLLLLHLGHWANLFWSWQITFVLPTVFTCILFAIVLSHKGLLNIRLAIIAGLCLIGLPLCGANGLLCDLMVLPLFACESFLHFRPGGTQNNRKAGTILIFAIIVTLLIMVAYFIGYERPYWNPPSPNLRSTIITTAKFLALCFGPSSSHWWTIAIVAALALVFATSIFLIQVAAKSKGVELRKAIAILFLLAGSMLFALVMGWGRAAWVPIYGLPIRYVILSVPTLILCYGTWTNFGLNRAGRYMQWSLFLIMLFLLYPNTREGIKWGSWYLHECNKVMKDIAKGVPHTQLAEKNQEFLLHWNKKMLITAMQQLKDAGMGPFTQMKEDPVKADSASFGRNY